MDLPNLIASLFDKFVSGILLPVLQGIYSIAPFVFMIGIIGCLALIAFSNRPGKVGGIIGLVVIAFLWPNLPDIMAALMSYSGGSIDMGPAIDIADSAIGSGAQDALDSLG